MQALYHVSDPKFWEMWRRYGRGASVEYTPRLGQQRLNITLTSGEEVALSGGTVIGVELVRQEPSAMVRVKLTNTAHCPNLVLEKGFGIKFEGAQDMLQLEIFRQQREHKGTLYVCYDYFWERPDEVHIRVFDEYPRTDGQSGYTTDYSSGTMTIEQLEGVLRSPALSVVSLPVTLLSRPHQRQREEGTLVLPAEVQLSHLQDTAKELLRFARFARAVTPTQPPSEQRRSA